MDLRRQTAVGGLDGAHTLEPLEVLGAQHVAPFDISWRTSAVNIADPSEVSAQGRVSRQRANISPRPPERPSSDPRPVASTHEHPQRGRRARFLALLAMR